jgi:hypothetical protein
MTFIAGVEQCRGEDVETSGGELSVVFEHFVIFDLSKFKPRRRVFGFLLAHQQQQVICVS